MSFSVLTNQSFTPIDAFPWTVKLAESPEEYQGMYRLRYEVFALETKNERLLSEFGIERDRYDQWCEHLIVKDQISGRVVGTYRFLSGDRAVMNEGFYSESEFDFSRSNWDMQNILELGRSCVAADHRNGRVIQLLWEGIVRYMHDHSFDLLFGCASMEVPNLHDLNTIVSWLKQKGTIRSDYGIRPHATHRIHNITDVQVLQADRELFRMLPPLLKGYLSLGAFIAGEPAYDPVFDTVDFLIVMPRGAINPRHLRRLFGASSHN